MTIYTYIYIVDLPIKKGDFPSLCYVILPEGNGCAWDGRHCSWGAVLALAK